MGCHFICYVFCLGGWGKMIPNFFFFFFLGGGGGGCLGFLKSFLGDFVCVFYFIFWC